MVCPTCSFKFPFTFRKSVQQSEKEHDDLAKALGLSQNDALVAIECVVFPYDLF